MQPSELRIRTPAFATHEEADWHYSERKRQRDQEKWCWRYLYNSLTLSATGSALYYTHRILRPSTGLQSYPLELLGNFSMGAMFMSIGILLYNHYRGSSGSSGGAGGAGSRGVAEKSGDDEEEDRLLV